MKIIFSKNIGSCSGVKRAISIVKNSLKEDPKPIYCLGELVHNEKIIKEFEKDGVIFIKDPRKARFGTLILRAHGFSPLPKKIFKRLKVRDAVCPFVKKVQTLAKFLSEKGYKVIIFGDKNHPETKGIRAFAKNGAVIIENEKEAERLPTFRKIGLLSQTTKDIEKFERIQKILKRKTQKIKVFNTICPEVLRRQKELNQILKIADAVLVIGSKKSANTKRLVEKVKRKKKKLIWVNSLEELKRKRLKGILVLGIVSGTSASDSGVQKIKTYLELYDKKKKNKNS